MIFYFFEVKNNLVVYQTAKVVSEKTKIVGVLFYAKLVNSINKAQSIGKKYAIK